MMGFHLFGARLFSVLRATPHPTEHPVNSINLRLSKLRNASIERMYLRATIDVFLEQIKMISSAQFRNCRCESKATRMPRINRPPSVIRFCVLLAEVLASNKARLCVGLTPSTARGRGDSQASPCVSVGTESSSAMSGVPFNGSFMGDTQIPYHGWDDLYG
jgi:hypothetical protein